MCSSSIRTFAAMCGASQPAGQQGQAGIQAQQEAATRQELFRTCRRTLVPIEKDFERGLHIRKLRLGPTCRYKILKPQFEDSKYRYSKLISRQFYSPIYSSRTVPNAIIAVQGENCAYSSREDNPQCILHPRRNRRNCKVIKTVTEDSKEGKTMVKNYSEKERR
ncbi:hypothetical protein Tcan_07827 [Toxocara canis]|uniref:Uncharacterized protein n=1 Tax=Toxocara canis TaxID=6265 RepID=A0A0B2W0X0_TOXCA|nr:hypothetical protein Tcan_07827 [Toxocara canis]